MTKQIKRSYIFCAISITHEIKAVKNHVKIYYVLAGTEKEKDKIFVRKRGIQGKFVLYWTGL